MSRTISDLFFACDLDDTMLDSQKQISPGNQRAIADFSSKGGKFVIATGRAVPATEPYVKQLDIAYPCVLYNGAAIYDFSAQKFIWTANLISEAREYLKEILTAFPEVGAEILKDEQIYVVRKNRYISEHVDVEQLDYCEVEPDDVPDGWFKILISSRAPRGPLHLSPRYRIRSGILHLKYKGQPRWAAPGITSPDTEILTLPQKNGGDKVH